MVSALVAGATELIGNRAAVQLAEAGHDPGSLTASDPP